MSEDILKYQSKISQKKASIETSIQTSLSSMDNFKKDNSESKNTKELIEASFLH